MNKLVCEMCNASDFVKEDGFFVCQYCGVKYSQEDAKRMIIDGTVSVQGSVKVDHSDDIKNHLINARRAMQKEDWEKTEHYYDLVEKHDPFNLEAIFYSAYGKAKSALIGNDIFKRQAAFKVLCNSTALLADKFHLEDAADQKALIIQIHDDIFAMTRSEYVYTQIITNGEVSSDNSAKTVRLFHELCYTFMQTVTAIADLYPENRSSEKIFYYELAIAQGKHILNNNCQLDADSIKKLLTSYQEQIELIQDPQAYLAKKRAKTNKNIFSIISLLSGLLNMVFMWIPGIQIAAIPLALAGFVCGIIGAGSYRKGSSKAGIVLNIIAFHIAIITTALYNA